MRSPMIWMRRLGKVCAAGLLAWMVSGCGRDGSPKEPEAAAPAVAVATPSQVENRDGVLRLKGSAEPFSGLLREWYTNGTLKAEAPVRQGRLHGATRGFHPNGAPQVEETFVEGVSHGLRLRFFEDGSPMSREEIREGRLHGASERFHRNGQRAERGAYVRGEPDGLAESWDATGKPVARVRFEAGKVVEQVFLSSPTPRLMAGAPAHD